MSGLLRAYKKPGRPACRVDGCDQPRYAKDLCTTHYTRLRRRGHEGSPERERGEFGCGYVNGDGYRVIHAPGHPLAGAQGKALEHRVVLYEQIGPGSHPCHWCGRSLPWKGGAKGIQVDHLDGDRLNNDAANLVVACLDCNTKRGTL